MTEAAIRVYVCRMPLMVIEYVMMFWGTAMPGKPASPMW